MYLLFIKLLQVHKISFKTLFSINVNVLFSLGLFSFVSIKTTTRKCNKINAGGGGWKFELRRPAKHDCYNCPVVPQNIAQKE